MIIGSCPKGHRPLGGECKHPALIFVLSYASPQDLSAYDPDIEWTFILIYLARERVKNKKNKNRVHGDLNFAERSGVGIYTFCGRCSFILNEPLTIEVWPQVIFSQLFAAGWHQ